MRYAAIMLSRQPLRPTGQTPWVKKSVEAVRWLKDNGLGLTSSVGLQTWELLTTQALEEAIPLRLVLPCSSSEEFINLCDRVLLDFGLSEDLVEFAMVREEVAKSRLGLSAARDRQIMETADLLIPVSCRPNGNMRALLDEAQKRGQEVEERFAVETFHQTEPLKYEVADWSLNPALLDIAGKYLIHWTRATNSPWPGETRVKFYRDILKSEAWPRSAYATLQRIVRMKKILASPRHMPRNTPTVSFSALSPAEAVPLMRWRARYREMSFEPYGIGIERPLAAKIGIDEVNYFESTEEVAIPVEERWKWQSSGKITPWRTEREYRCRGDLNLGGIPSEALAMFCRTVKEAEQLREVHKGPIWPFVV